MNEPESDPKPLSSASLWGGLALLLGGLILALILWSMLKWVVKLALFVAILAGLLLVIYWWTVGRKIDR